MSFDQEKVIVEMTGYASEEFAAAALGIEPRTLRKNVIALSMPIRFRNTNGRNYQYKWDDVIKYIRSTSTEAA